MTEEYHSSPYEGNVQPVVYQENNFNRTSAWLWVDEFNTNTFQPVFSDNTTSPISVDNASLLQYFSFHGMAEAISAREFITGLLPAKPPLLRSSTSSTSHPGEQITITLDIQNPDNIAITVKSLIISTPFGVYDVLSSALSFPMTSNSTFTTSITIPTSVLAGNYTLTSIADWQFNPQLMENIGSDPLQANTTITVNGAANPAKPHPSTPPPSSTPPSTATANPNPLLTLLRTVLLPVLLAYTGAMALFVALVIRRERQQILLPPVLIAPFCRVCGNPVGRIMLFCPNCGTPLTSPNDPATLSANPEPPSLP